MELSGGEVKKRWRNLRDTFIRTRKTLKNKKSDPAAGDQRIWKYYHNMTFLEPFIKEHDTSANLTAYDPQEEEEEEQRLPMMPVTEDGDGGAADLARTIFGYTTNGTRSFYPSTQQMPQTSTQKTKPGKRRRLDQSKSTELILSREEDIRAQIQHTAEDEDERFLQSILPILKRLVGARKSEAKMEIMKVLHELEFE